MGSLALLKIHIIQFQGSILTLQVQSLLGSMMSTGLLLFIKIQAIIYLKGISQFKTFKTENFLRILGLGNTQKPCSQKILMTNAPRLILNRERK